MRYLFIMNPGSKSGKSKRSFYNIFKILDRSKVQYDFKITQSLKDAYQLSLEGNRLGYEVIAAVGGDGTINQVLNGFYGVDGKRLSGAKFGVIYTGTSPDFCKSYGIPVDIERAVEVLLGNGEDERAGAGLRTKKIQIGKIICAESYFREFDDKSLSELESKYVSDELETKFITCYFACCVNVGLGADLARRANSGVRGVFGDYLGTFSALIRTLISYKPSDFMVCVDGKTTKLSKVYNISIGRTFYIASGIKVNHDLADGDNRLYMMIVRNIKLSTLPGILKTIYRGKGFANNEMIFLDYLKTIEVSGNSRNPEVEFDGDPGGFLPCRISMAGDDLELIY